MLRWLLARPGVMLLLTGIVVFLVRNLFGWIPLIGGIVTLLLVFASIFFVLGGVWLIVRGGPVD